jgi:hypothetical protein
MLIVFFSIAWHFVLQKICSCSPIKQCSVYKIDVEIGRLKKTHHLWRLEYNHYVTLKNSFRVFSYFFLSHTGWPKNPVTVFSLITFYVGKVKSSLVNYVWNAQLSTISILKFSCKLLHWWQNGLPKNPYILTERIVDRRLIFQFKTVNKFKFCLCVYNSFVSMCLPSSDND